MSSQRLQGSFLLCKYGTFNPAVCVLLSGADTLADRPDRHCGRKGRLTVVGKRVRYIQRPRGGASGLGHTYYCFLDEGHARHWLSRA